MRSGGAQRRNSMATNAPEEADAFRSRFEFKDEFGKRGMGEAGP